jgi:hypothetical protein
LIIKVHLSLRFMGGCDTATYLTIVYGCKGCD